MLSPVSSATAKPAEFPGFAICRGLGRQATLAAAASSVRQTFARGKTLFSEGHQADNIYEVALGTLRLHKLLKDGRRQITAFPTAGQLLGLARDGLYLHSAEAITEVTVRCYSRAGFSRLVEHVPGFRQRLMVTISDELRAAQDRMLLLGKKTAIEKVASFILQLANCGGTGNRGRVQMPMIGPDIADYLGLTPETVSRAFSELQHERKIERPSISRLRILDRYQLENCAAGSAQNLRRCGFSAGKVIQLRQKTLWST